MRFHRDGPEIPDDLLIARDEGRVVFFCGSGVSRARAGLPDFLGLARQVTRALGASTHDPAFLVLDDVGNSAGRTAISVLPSVDRVFSLLEREFEIRDLERAVAQALRPANGVDLSAHQTLLDLATTPEGRVQLITTNFDRLFESCREDLEIHLPPRLPDLRRTGEMSGLIYLHGCATRDYDGAQGEGFVLSSSSFGRAYLSDGWATHFLQAVLKRYVVVFVGYSADDPPVQYLLEALNSAAGNPLGAYAFQSGPLDSAASRWAYRGVTAIPYLEQDGHRGLWETLAAWALRAREPERWYASVVDLAKRGPEQLEPYERGQVAHIVTTDQGMGAFTEGPDSPPADWLCVFDPDRRYATPDRTGSLLAQEVFVDPFTLYGLDGDASPRPFDPEERWLKRDVPEGAWDGLMVNRWDRKGHQRDTYLSVRGLRATTPPEFPPRLRRLAWWIGKVSDQPAAVWWAAQQQGLHPSLLAQIDTEMSYLDREFAPEIRRAWGYLFEAEHRPKGDDERDWHRFKKAVEKAGWNSASVRRLSSIDRPYLTVKAPSFGGPVPPKTTDPVRMEELLEAEVVYPGQLFDIPGEWLGFAVSEIRRNLEYAVRLEKELGGYRLNIDATIVRKTGALGRSGSSHGISGQMIRFCSLFERLVDVDSTGARNELNAWPADDDTIFSRLRIWASGIPEIVPAEEFSRRLGALSEEAFWDFYHQRDLLLVLARRWADLETEARRTIEQRLLEGPPSWPGEEKAAYEQRRAAESLNRLHWLAAKGCGLTLDLDAETERLTRVVPDWQLTQAKRAAESLEGRAEIVQTKTEYTALVGIPSGCILQKTLELKKGREDPFVEHDPFAGLCSERPVRALSALTLAAKRNEYPVWAWKTFLFAQRQGKSTSKLTALIAERLSRCPDEVLAQFVHAAADWLQEVSESLGRDFPDTLETIIRKLISVLRRHPIGSASVSGKEELDWALNAINAPAGKIAMALMQAPQREAGLSPEWTDMAGQLLSLSEGLRSHSLVIFGRGVCWLHSRDRKWTENRILSKLGSKPDGAALLSGFLWGVNRVPRLDLWTRLKPHLLGVVTQRNGNSLLEKYGSTLERLFLSAWAYPGDEEGQYLSDSELREAILRSNDALRSGVLRTLRKWASEEGEVGERWRRNLLTLVREVWPRQKAVRTSAVSAAFCELLLADRRFFPEIAEAVLPLLGSVAPDRVLRLSLLWQEARKEIIADYPEYVLRILDTVLPVDVHYWPHEIDELLQGIAKATPGLETDPRLVELRRRWNSR